MPDRVYRHLTAFRRRARRSWLASRLLGRGRPTPRRPGAGLILLQIDGLARRHLERAMATGRMPFLRGLARGGDHELRDFYSGLPASTPAVQGEILFGVRTAVPSFSFFDREAGVERRMYEPESARAIAEELDGKSDEPLLRGGSSYSNIYTAGADCARFCAERLDLPSILKDVSWGRVLALLLLYLPRFLRVAFLGVVEILLAVVDFVRGVIARKDLVQELRFIPTRLGVCIVLRELIEFMIQLDIQAGVPIIHATLLGYDEQAHRRGPDSRFAYWTLRGIDRLVRNVSRSAALADARDYEVVIYSDHGQEATQVYRDRDGRNIETVVREVFEPLMPELTRVRRGDPGRASLDARGRSLLRRRGRLPEAPAGDPEDIVVTAMGPVGHVYVPGLAVDGDVKRVAARRLARSGGVPLVFHLDADGRVWCETPQETLALPEDGERVVGAEHPFVREVVDDLVELCRHRHAGDLILGGWRRDGAPLTFAREGGSHAGPGTTETHGFVIAPRGFLHSDQGSRVRGEDLYRASRRHLGRLSRGSHESPPAVITAAPSRLRVATYNIHGCRGIDGRLHPGRVARVIAALRADVVALQEVDVGRARSRGEDQARLLAERLGMRSYFLPLVRFAPEGERYGLAILSRIPLEVVKEGELGDGGLPAGREPRGAMWARIPRPDGPPIHFVNTHLGLRPAERLAQVNALLGAQWLAEVIDREPLILCGDLNCSPRGRVYRRLATELSDVQVVGSSTPPYRTFTSARPLLRIDHIFVNSLVRVSDVHCARSPRARLASDHLPICAEVDCVAPSASIAGGELATAADATGR